LRFVSVGRVLLAEAPLQTQQNAAVAWDSLAQTVAAADAAALAHVVLFFSTDVEGCISASFIVPEDVVELMGSNPTITITTALTGSNTYPLTYQMLIE
jgi:hypothetical protein